MNSFQHLESWPIIPDPGNPSNKISFSDLTPPSSSKEHGGIAINYVVQGSQEYQVGQQTFTVLPKQFLLRNEQDNSQSPVHSNPSTQGLSICLDPTFVGQVYQTLANSLEQQLADPYATTPSCFEIFEHVHPAKNSPLNPIINQVLGLKETTVDRSDLPDLFLGISEGLLLHEMSIRQKIDRIKSSKKSTREELFRRLLMAQQFIREHFTRKISVKEVAKAACLSEYHFIRTFKQCFDKTPIQYLKELRLESAKKLLLSETYSISEIATLCGFSDIFYFSLSFKKAFQQSPTLFRQTAGN